MKASDDFVLHPEKVEFGVRCTRHGYSHPYADEATARRNLTVGFGAGCPDAHIVARVVTRGPWGPVQGGRR